MANLQLERIEKSFGSTRVIHGVDLSIEDGEFVVFVGPSGCGKSTLLRLICGLDPVTSGEIRIDGTRVNDVPAADRGLAMVFQSYALYPHMTVRDNLAFGLENIGTSRVDIERKVGEAAKMLRLDGLLQRRPTQLSGGQRQRVAIGRAIVREPRIFLFDEPLSNLDAELRVSMRSEIIALHQRLRTTMIYVTHDQVEAMTMANRIAVLRDGRIEQFGPPLDLYNSPCNRFVAGFIGSPQMNFLPVRTVAVDATGIDVSLPAGAPMHLPFFANGIAAGTSLTLGIRPEHLALAPDEATHPAERGCLDLRVEQVEQLGGHCLLHGRVSGHDSPVTLSANGQTAVRVGDSVPVVIDPARCHLFLVEGRALGRAMPSAKLQGEVAA